MNRINILIILSFFVSLHSLHAMENSSLPERNMEERITAAFKEDSKTMGVLLQKLHNPTYAEYPAEI